MIELRRRTRYGVALALLLGCLSQLGFALAAESARSQQQTQKQLKKLQADIKKLERSLRASEGERKQLTQALRQAEKAGGNLSRQVAANKRKIGQQSKKIDSLNVERQQLSQRRDAQLDALADEIAAAYRTGRQDQLRLLLNQQQPEQVARMLRYHQYFSEARSAAVVEVEQTLSRLDQVELKLKQHRQQLETEQQQLQTRSQSLKQSRQQRQQALAAIKRQASSQSQSLQRLKTDQQRLKRVLEELQQTLALNELKVTTQAFAKLKGKLHWPTPTTRVAQSFGGRNSQGIRRDGMLIRARMGDSVKAVHNGRVVFSDWMRGYGMLLILDHGDGYMSLYGHNQSLLKQVGDWVAASEQVATAGDSGGQSQTGLYFAIRYKGEAINPKAWLKRG